MKKILILLIILGGLIGTAVFYQKQQQSSMNTAGNTGVKMRERLLPEINLTEVKKIRLKDANSEVTLSISADGKSATVKERSDYPASVDRITTALRELYQQRIASKQTVRKGAWADIEVQPPGEGNTGIGTQVELMAEGDKVIKSLILGKQLNVVGGRSNTQFDAGNQRFVRMPEDGDTIWVISNTFFSLEPKPEVWLDKAFIDVQKIKEISASFPDSQENWKIARNNESDTQFTLVDAKPGEALDAPKLPVQSLLSAPVFNDVLPKDQADAALKDAIKVKILTFDGFTYDVVTAKQSKDGTDRYYMKVDVLADIPKARAPVKDEKEEDKKKADEAFATTKKNLEDKLAKEKKFAGWVFEVSEYTVNNLFKKRSEVVQVEAKATPAPAAATAPEAAAPASAPTPAASPASPAPVPATEAPTAPMPAPAAEASTTPAADPASMNVKPASVATPPIEIPVAPAPEIKPEADPAAAPQIEKKD